MNQKENIKQLLEKYLDGQSSLKEEKQLRYYFLFEEVADEYKEYQSLFQFYEEEKKHEYSESFEPNKNKTKTLKLSTNPIWKFAAAAVIIFGIGWAWMSTQNTQELQQLSPYEIEITQKYLSLSLNSFDENYHKSAKLLQKATEIDKNTQKIQEMGQFYQDQKDKLKAINHINKSVNQLKTIKKIQKSRIKLVM